MALPAAPVLRVAYSVMIFGEIFTQHATCLTQVVWPEDVICTQRALHKVALGQNKTRPIVLFLYFYRYAGAFVWPGVYLALAAYSIGSFNHI